MKLIKRVSRPSAQAIEQGEGSGVWLVPADSSGTTATRAQVDAVTLPHPEGGGRRMLRQVPAGVVLIEVVDGRIAVAEPKPLEEPLEEPMDGESVRTK
jgi:hypothetical protein